MFILDRKDIDYLRAIGKSPAEFCRQLRMLQEKDLSVHLVRACALDDGILALSATEAVEYGRVWDREAARGCAAKFVASSGIGSRMLQSLYTCVQKRSGDSGSLRLQADKGDSQAREFLQILQNVDRLAIFEDLRARGHLAPKNGFWPDRQALELAEVVIRECGRLPKALLAFHLYPDGVRTALEEHLLESALYLGDQHGVVRAYFTTTQGHYSIFHERLEISTRRFENPERRFQVRLLVSPASTLTPTISADGSPFRLADGTLLLHPGGHGALLQSLNACSEEVVFIRTIDNVLPECRWDPAVFYRKALGGYLLTVQLELFRLVERLSQGETGLLFLQRVEEFARSRLLVSPEPEISSLSCEQKRCYWLRTLNRPLRVCGVVQHEGEVGGGPFWVRNEDGGTSIQIIESAQVARDVRRQRRIWESARYFNPVDIVCGLRDFLGERFHLPDFQDPNAAMVVEKSWRGHALKALELPGLWNGAMAAWNTILVEVPRNSFRPVKRLTDLLSSEHLTESGLA